MAIVSVNWRAPSREPEGDLVGGRGGAQVLAHGLSKAGDEGGVQPVGLGDQPFGGAERLTWRGSPGRRRAWALRKAVMSG